MLLKNVEPSGRLYQFRIFDYMFFESSDIFNTSKMQSSLRRKEVTLLKLSVVST